jgi:membrane protein implicated in regulation of membrane protease activity
VLPSFTLISAVTNSTTPPELPFSARVFWLISGVSLCLIELFVVKTLATRYRKIALTLGVTSLIVALLLWRANTIPPFNLQVIYWMLMSTACVIWIRPMLMRRKAVTIPDADEAKTITEILPGETGRVIYEGSSWQACCEDRSLAIACNQKVYVLRREGNTLIVAPESLFHS